MNINLKIVAILGALAVALGAFGAHALKPHMDISQIETFKTASLYHFVHLIAMLILSLSAPNDPIIKRSFYLFAFGILCFSGSLYILSTRHLYGGDSWSFVGPVTPIGGVLFILGWLNLILFKKS